MHRPALPNRRLRERTQGLASLLEADRDRDRREKTSFLTPQGRHVTALASGPYSITVDDKSKTRGFSFAGHSTAKNFSGRVTWRITLAPRQYGTVTVLAGG